MFTEKRGVAICQHLVFTMLTNQNGVEFDSSKKHGSISLSDALLRRLVLYNLLLITGAFI